METQDSSAFPITDASSPLYAGYGLSKRELFAAMAMQAYLPTNKLAVPRHFAHQAVIMADELIKALGES